MVFSTNSSTSKVLLADASFVSSGDYIPDHSSVTVCVKASHDGTLYVEFSPDQSNWDHSLSFAYTATESMYKCLETRDRWCRVRFVNSSTDQTSFRLTTSYKKATKSNLQVNNEEASFDNPVYVSAVDRSQSIFRSLALSTTGLLNASTPCLIDHILVHNAGTGTNTAFLKLYNMDTTADSTDTPDLTFPVEASTTLVLNFGSKPVQFDTGLSIRATSGQADNDNVAPAGNVTVNIMYSN